MSQNASTLDVYFTTFDDEEPYFRQSTLVEVVSWTFEPDGSIVIVSHENQADNSDKNRHDQLTDGPIDTAHAIELVKTYVVVGGKFKLADIEFRGEV